MLNRILAESEEVWTGDGVAVLAVADVVGAAHDDRPCASRCTGNDVFWQIIRIDHELRPVAAVQNLAAVDDISVRVDSREVTSGW